MKKELAAKNTEPPVTCDESIKESNEEWCNVDNFDKIEEDPSESDISSDISSVANNLLNKFNENKDDKNYNKPEMNMKYSLTNKDGDYDESIFESYEYSVDVLDAMEELENNNTHCIWSTNPKVTWISWFMDNEIGFQNGISSRQLSTDDVRKLYPNDFRLHHLLPINIEFGWEYKRNIWKFFGLGYGGDPKPITINGKIYYNAPPPKKLIHSKFIDLSGIYPKYEKILDFDCYGLWLDNGDDNEQFRIYGIFNSDKGLVVRSLQLYVDPLIIGETQYDITYWEEYNVNSNNNNTLVNKRVESFINLLKYMNPEIESFKKDEILSSNLEFEETKENDSDETNYSINNIVMTRWNDGKYYHSRIENIDDNNYYVTYIGYNDSLYKVKKSDIIFRIGNSTELILREADLNVQHAKLEVKKAELQLKITELKLKRIMYCGE